MANDGGSSPLDIRCVFVETNLETRLALLVHKDESISDFKEKLCKEHNKCFPQVGDINISALKVKRRREFFHLPDSMNMLCKAFEGIKRDWFMYVDAVKVDKCEKLLAVMDVDQHCSNPESFDKKKEIAVDSVGQSRDLTLAEGLKTEVKKTRKRKTESSDGTKSRKKRSVDINQSAVAVIASGNVVDERKTQVDVVASELCAVSPREKVDDDILMGAVGKDIESGEKNGIGMEENQQTSEVNRLGEEKILTVNSTLVDGQTRGEVKDVEANQTLQEALATDVAMRKSINSDESHKSCGKVPTEKLDDLRGAKEQDCERDERRSSSPYLLTAEVVTYPENQLEASSNLTTGTATEKKKRQKQSSKDHINLYAVAATSGDIVNVVPVSRRETLGNPLVAAIQKDASKDDVNESHEKLDGFLSGTVEKDHERCEGRSSTPSLQTAEVATYPEDQLEASSNLTTGPATEKKQKRKKSSKDHINQPAVALPTTSRDINVDTVSRRETLVNPLVEAIQKDTSKGDVVESHEMVDGYLPGTIEKDHERGEGKSSTPNLQNAEAISYPENQLEASSNLTTVPATDKKKKRKKSSEDHINQPPPAATTTSRDIVNVDPLSRSETLGNPLAEAILKENDMEEKSDKDVRRDKVETDNLASNLANHLDTNSGLTTSPVTEKKKRGKRILKENKMDEKRDDDVGIGKAIPSVADSNQTNNFVSFPENQETNSGLTTGPATEKRRKQKKSSKDHIRQSTVTPTISGDRVDVTSESFLQTENEMGDKSVNNVGPTNNLQDADLASTPVQESKTLDHIGKFTEDNITREYEVAKENTEIDAGDAKSAKSTRKTKSRKAKTPAKEDTLVASGAQNVETITKVVDGGEPNNIIRNVLDSLQQKNVTEENMGIIRKKSSKKSRKKDSLDIVEAQVLSVEVKSTAENEVPLISNPKDTDVSFNDTESHLKKSIEVADNPGEQDPSKQILVEKADIVDDFGSSQKDTIVGGGKRQDRVTGKMKSKKEKKSLDLHPGGSTDGSLSSLKPKERKGRVQTATLDNSQLQSRVKNDRRVSTVDRSNASVKGDVNKKKEAGKESSNSVTVNKSTMNFFKDAELDSTEDESNKTASDVSTKSPSDSPSDDDSDVTSMSRKQGNILPGGTNRFSGSLNDILRSSKSFKMAKLRASQSQPDTSDDEIPPLDCVPDSQAN